MQSVSDNTHLYCPTFRTPLVTLPRKTLANFHWPLEGILPVAEPQHQGYSYISCFSSMRCKLILTPQQLLQSHSTSFWANIFGAPCPWPFGNCQLTFTTTRPRTFPANIFLGKCQTRCAHIRIKTQAACRIAKLHDIVYLSLMLSHLSLSLSLSLFLSFVLLPLWFAHKIARIRVSCVCVRRHKLNNWDTVEEWERERERNPKQIYNNKYIYIYTGTNT